MAAVAFAGGVGVAYMYTVRTHVGGTALAVIKRYTVRVQLTLVNQQLLRIARYCPQ